MTLSYNRKLHNELKRQAPDGYGLQESPSRTGGEEMKVLNIRRLAIGLFPYWIGFSNRRLGTKQRVIDCGFIKFMWSKP